MAFTLIEMLLVVVIIMVLAGILIPAFSRVREYGRSTACSSNLRQLQLAAINYANDAHNGVDGALPYAVSTLVTPSAGAPYELQGWVAWYNYTAGSATPGSYANAGVNGITCITNGPLYTYVNNVDVYMCPSLKISNPTYTRGYSMATNNGISGALLLSPSTLAATSVLFGDDKNVGASPYDSQFDTNEVATLHNNHGNVVYLDGHVQKR